MPNSKPPAGPVDIRHIRELADLLNETGLTEIEVDRDGARIRDRQSPSAPGEWGPRPSPDDGRASALSRARARGCSG